MLIPVNVDHLVLVELNPTVIIGGGSITAGLDVLVLTEYNAAVGLSTNVTAGLDALVLVEYDVKLDVNIVAGVDALVIATFDPVVARGLNIYPVVSNLNIIEYTVELSRALDELANEISSGSRMVKELKASSEMNL